MPPDRAGGRGRSGVTLIELVISIAVLGIALTGTLLAMGTATRGSVDPMILHQATAIAEATLEEILLKPFYDPDTGSGGGVCPTPEATRALYDNVCDYRGLDDSGPRDQNGTAVSGLDLYRVRVDVDTTAALGGLTGSDRIVRVDVRVTHTDLVDATLSGYRAEY